MNELLYALLLIEGTGRYDKISILSTIRVGES